MRISNSLLLTYQTEYENTPDLTIEQLCEKYNVTTKQLKGYTKWKKHIVIPDSSPLVTKQPIATPTNNNLDKEQLVSDIDTFKSLAMAHALKFMKHDAEFAEVKEFKDMVSIVGTIEASIKDDKPENVINIAIQNIVKGFQDDC